MSKNKIKPNFFIIGAAKSATTSLSSLLEQHPEAAIVQGKEPHFFSVDSLYSLGWKKYLELYSHCKSETAIGDASTSYSRIRYHPKTISRIKKHMPNAKIIYMVRNPLARMESAYLEHMASPGGAIFESVSDAVTKQPMIIDSSRYWEVFDAYRQHFSEKQIRIIWFEEYVKNTKAVYQDVCQFLEINNNFSPELEKESTNSRAHTLNRAKQLGANNLIINTEWEPKVRQQVINEIRDDNLKFLKHFNKPVNYWGELF